MGKINKTIPTMILICLLSSCASTNDKKNRFIHSLVQKMMLDEKIGQMTQVDKRMLDSEKDIATYFLGSILSGFIPRS